MKVYYNNENVEKIQLMEKLGLYSKEDTKNLLENVNKKEPYYIYFESEKDFKKFENFDFDNIIYLKNKYQNIKNKKFEFEKLYNSGLDFVVYDTTNTNEPTETEEMDRVSVIEDIV